MSDPAAVPEGYEVVKRTQGASFAGLVGPFYAKREGRAICVELIRELAEIPGIRVPAAPESNIVMFERAGAAAWSAALRARGVLANPVASDALRAVTHLDVTAADIDAALVLMREVRV